MKWFSRVFLGLLALDGAFSLANGAWLGVGGAGTIPGTDLCASALALAATVVFVALHFATLSKRVLLLPCLVTLWMVLGAMPLPLQLDSAARLGTLGVIECVVAGLALWLAGVGRTGVRPPAGPESRGRAFLQMTAISVGLVLPGLATYTLLSAEAALRHFTAGFLELRGDGLHAQERTYVRDSQEIRLVATVHVADPEFYASLFDGLEGVDARVLLEGVSDAEGKLPAGLDYGGLAEELGLVDQGRALVGRAPEGARTADVDVAAFSKETIEVLRAMGEVFALWAQGRRDAAFDAYLEIVSREPDLESIRADVLDLRNAHVLEEIERALEEAPLVVVPWGAAHMPGIEAGVRSLGFELVATRDRPVMRLGADSRRPISSRDASPSHGVAALAVGSGAVYGIRTARMR